MSRKSRAKPYSPFRYFHSAPELIREVVMLYIRLPLSLRNVEDLLSERGDGLCHETVRMWWNRFGPMFAAEIRRRRISRMRGFRHWKWHLDEMYVKLNGEMVYLWRAVDHEGENPESYVAKKRDKAAISTDENIAEIRLSSRKPAQSFQRRTPPRRPPNIQASPFGALAEWQSHMT